MLKDEDSRNEHNGCPALPDLKIVEVPKVSLEVKRRIMCFCRKISTFALTDFTQNYRKSYTICWWINATKVSILFIVR